MNHIQKASSILLVVFNCLLVATPCGIALLWLCIEAGWVKELLSQGILMKTVSTPEGLVNLSQVKWTFLSKSISCLGHSLGLLPLFLGFLLLKSVFKNYQIGNIFSVANAKNYGKLGLLLFLDALLTTPLSQMLMTLGVTISNPPGHRFVSLSFGTLNLEILFCGALVMVISWVMMEGSRINEDNRLTV